MSVKRESTVNKFSKTIFPDEDCPGEDVGVLKCRDPTQTNPKRRDDRMETGMKINNCCYSSLLILIFTDFFIFVYITIPVAVCIFEHYFCTVL